MARVMEKRNHTGALLIALNALSKLLATRWPWLLGGAVDAPGLLAQLSVITAQGLDHVCALAAGGWKIAPVLFMLLFERYRLVDQID